MSDTIDRPIALTVQAYHGAACRITAFEPAYLGLGNDQMGSGYYFTTSEGEALGYTERRLAEDLAKPGPQGEPTVMACTLTFEGLISPDTCMALPAQTVLRIMRRSPNLEDALWNFGDLSNESQAVVEIRASRIYAQLSDQPILRTLFSLANDFFDGSEALVAFNQAIKDELGIDGVVEHYDHSTHYVVYNAAQITVDDWIDAPELAARFEQEERAANARKMATAPR